MKVEFTTQELEIAIEKDIVRNVEGFEAGIDMQILRLEKFSNKWKASVRINHILFDLPSTYSIKGIRIK